MRNRASSGARRQGPWYDGRTTAAANPNGSVADVASEAAAHGLEFAPGARFNYSDAGADTLGAIVAKVSGQKVEDFVQQRILEPLGMTESLTLLAGDDPRRARIPSAYSGGPGNCFRAPAPGFAQPQASY